MSVMRTTNVLAR